RKIPGVRPILPPAFVLAEPRETVRALYIQFPFLVVGSLQRMEGKIRLLPRMLDASGEVFSTNYDRVPKNFLGVPNDLTLRIAEHAGLRLLPATKQKIAQPSTTNAEAYDFYLRGR